jgi:uncharacterized coiled-coil protein SlyX
MNDRFEAIETKIAYLEHANAELSDVVYRQRQELETLQLRVAALAGRFEGAQLPATAYTVEEEKPPHY